MRIMYLRVDYIKWQILAVIGLNAFATGIVVAAMHANRFMLLG